MKLVSYSKVRKFIGFDDGVQKDAIAGSIDKATPVLAGDLRVASFDRASFTDLFAVSHMGCLQFAGNQYRTRLALSAGFVSGAVALTWGTDPAGGNDLDASQVLVNKDKGGLIIVGVDLRDTFVQASYDAGFPVSEDDETMYDPSAIPDWLQQAATLQAIIILDSTNPTVRHTDEGAAARSIKGMQDTYNEIIGGKLRYFPSETHPLA